MARSQAEDRLFYGYRLRTSLRLEALPSLPQEGEADITLEVGDVPRHLAALTWSSPFIEIGEDGRVLVHFGDGVRFLVRDGWRVVLDEASASCLGDIEALLLGTVAGVLLHQRGDLPLHASGVVIGNRAVALAGPSGRGKSTLAAALAAQEYALISDDIFRVRFTDGKAWAVPGSSRLRLWPHAAGLLFRAPETLVTGRIGHPKRLLVLPPAPEAVPLGALIRLRIDTRLKTPRLTRLSGPMAIMPAEDVVYRARLGRRLGRRIGLFQDLARLAALVPVFALTRTGDPDDLSDLARLVVSVMTDGI